MAAHRAVIYTALAGGYYPEIPPAPAVDALCVAFTDTPDAPAPGWDVRPLPYAHADPRMAAKWPKLHPHRLFPDADVSIWIDAGWQAHASLLQCLEYLNGAGQVFYPHRWRRTVREELAATTHPKYAGLPLAEQVNTYYGLGYADQVPLLECTSIARRHHDQAVAALNEAWWAECLRWTPADQLSLPFLLWATGAPYSRYPFTLAGQQWLTLRRWRDD